MVKNRSKAIAKIRAEDALNRKKFLAKLPKTEKQWLELLLHFTKRAIKSSKDTSFIDQAARLTRRIALLDVKVEKKA